MRSTLLRVPTPAGPLLLAGLADGVIKLMAKQASYLPLTARTLLDPATRVSRLAAAKRKYDPDGTFMVRNSIA